MHPFKKSKRFSKKKTTQPLPLALAGVMAGCVSNQGCIRHGYQVTEVDHV